MILFRQCHGIFFSIRHHGHAGGTTLNPTPCRSMPWLFRLLSVELISETSCTVKLDRLCSKRRALKMESPIDLLRLGMGRRHRMVKETCSPAGLVLDVSKTLRLLVFLQPRLDMLTDPLVPTNMARRSNLFGASSCLVSASGSSSSRDSVMELRELLRCILPLRPTMA